MGDEDLGDLEVINELLKFEPKRKERDNTACKI